MIVDSKIGINIDNPYFYKLVIPCLVIGVYAFTIFNLLTGLNLFHTILVVNN